MGQQQGGGLHIAPLRAQWLHDGGQNQALHIGARRVVGAQGVALGGVERALQERAKDGGLHLAPVGLRGQYQQVDLRGGQPQAVAIGARALEQRAIELEHRLGQRGTKAAHVHIGPQAAQHVLQRGGVLAVGLQQAQKRTLGQERHVFGKHAKQAAREVGGDLLGGVAGLFERAGQQRQAL